MLSPASPAGSEEFPPARVAWRAAIILTVVFTAAFIHRIGLSLYVEPIKAALSLTDTQIGLVSGVFFAVPYTIFGLLGGWFTDRGNRVRLLACAAFVWSAATAAIGFAASFLHIALARIVTGIGQAPVQPACASLISDLFPPARRGRAFGLFIAATAFGTAGALLLGALSVTAGQRLGPRWGLDEWRAGIMLLGAAGGLVLLLLWSLREPRRHERALGRPSKLVELRAFCVQHAWLLVSLFAGVTFAFLAPYGQLAFMPALFSRKFGWSADQLAYVYGLIAIVAGGGGALWGGWLSDRWRDRGRSDGPWRLCLYGAALSLFPAALAPLCTNAWAAIALYGLAAWFANWPSIGALAAIAEIAPNEFRGQITAGHTACIGLFAAGLGPLFVGLSNDRLFGSDAALDRSLALVFAGSAVASVLLLALGRGTYVRTIDRRKGRQP